MEYFLEDVKPEIQSPYGPAKALARRFEALDINPYASDKDRYFVPLDDSGEIIEVGKPLKSSRIFGPTALRKNIPLVDAFSRYAGEVGLQNCYYWSVKLTGAKASSDELSTALERFNTRINVVFSDLRKKFGFEPLLIAIHPHYDAVSDLFDLHAHFICRVPPPHLDEVTIKLAVKFSLVDLPRARIQNAEAVSTYMLWGIWRNKEMLAWPDHALKTAWNISRARFRLMRTGGSFQKYRARVSADNASEKEARAATVSKEVVAANRQATAAPRMEKYHTGDRVLTRVMIKRDGQRVAALLYENSDISKIYAEEPQRQEGQAGVKRCSAASSAVIQEAEKTRIDSKKISRTSIYIKLLKKHIFTCMSSLEPIVGRIGKTLCRIAKAVSCPRWRQ